MNTEFIRSLIQQLNPLNRLILSRTVSLREKAMSVRKATRVLPVELSVVIASSAISDACYDMYAKILEIAILLYIRENSHGYKKRVVWEFEEPHAKVYSYSENIRPINTNYVFRPEYRISSGWLDRVIAEIVTGPMWSRIIRYIDNDNIVQTICHVQYLHLDVSIIMRVLSSIVPNAYNSIYAERNIYEDEYIPDDEDFIFSRKVYCNYLNILKFDMWIDSWDADLRARRGGGRFRREILRE